MSSVINKVKDVITGRINIHHSNGVVGHNIRPHNFPKDPNPDKPFNNTNPFSDLRNPNKHNNTIPKDVRGKQIL